MQFRLRRLAVVVAAPVLAATVSLPLAAGTVSATPAHQSFNKAVALKFIRTSLAHVKVGSPMLVHKATSGDIKATAVTSGNWSGYADLDTTFTMVRAEWTEPKVTCPSTSGYALAAFWVGIDGFSSQTVEQDGTMAECDSGSLLGTFDWWEMYPTNSVQLENSVNVGDKITAKVILSGGSYALSVKDATTTSASFTTTQTCGTTACDNSSAEWIGEAPCCSSGSTVYPLAKFTPWHVTGAEATGGGKTHPISKFSYDSITMTGSSSDTLAAPGALNTAGNTFTDKWYASS